SSVNAIVVAVVIVGSPRNRLVGRTSTLSGSTVAAPDREWPPLRGKPLRASPYAPCRAERLTPLPGTSTERRLDRREAAGKTSARWQSLERIAGRTGALAGYGTDRWFPKLDAIPFWIHDPTELAEL